MSEIEAQYVKMGYWINYEKGSTLGQTITTDSRTGSFIIVMLAMLTSLGVKSLWHLLTFAYHQLRANGHPSDGYFRQQQVLLRTLPTPTALIADSAKFWFAWRKPGEGTTRRTLAVTSVTSLYVVASLAAAIFSSYVATSSNVEVLVNSPHCGSLDWDVPSWQSYFTSIQVAASLYGPECYRNGTLPSRCNIFSRPNVAFSTRTEPCPFNSTICFSPAITLDSGFVDVGKTFGLNLKTKDRMKYRKRSTCAVLALEGHTEIANDSFIRSGDIGRDVLSGEEFILYYYGANEPVGDPTYTPYTFYQSFYSANFTTEIRQHRNIQYARWLDDNFVVIPELQLRDADVALRLTELNSVRYDKPNNDPMFSAHKFGTLKESKGPRLGFYYSDRIGSMMGCSIQYQFCFGDAIEKCTELQGAPFEMSREIFPEANDIQYAIMLIFRSATALFDVLAPGRYKVMAELTSPQAMTIKLPDDQWILEIQGWESIVWAGQQIVFADYAIGPTVRDPAAASYVIPPTNEAERSLCSIQKMRRAGGFTNINYFGLVFIITISSVATIIDLVLLRFVIELNKFRKVDTPRIDRWMQDSIYQLQRRAYEAQGHGVWEELSNEIPITVEKTKLPDLHDVVIPITSQMLEKSSAVIVSDIEIKLDGGDRPKQSPESPT